MATAANSNILIVDGKPACAAAQDAGHETIAWTSAPDWNEELRGRQVILWPTNHKASIDRMRKLAVELHCQGCSLKMVTGFRELPEGHSAAHIEPDKINQLVGAAAPLTKIGGKPIEKIPIKPKPEPPPESEPANTDFDSEQMDRELAAMEAPSMRAVMDCEQAVIAGALECGEVAAGLEPSHFSDGFHKALWSAILQVQQDGLKVEAVAVAERLSGLDDAKIEYIGDLAENSRGTANLAHYADKVRGEPLPAGLIDPDAAQSLTLNDLLADGPDPKPVIRALPADGLTVVAAEPGAGKSTMFALWGTSVALGIELGDGQPSIDGGEVVILAAEEKAKKYRQRIRAQLIHHGKIDQTQHTRRLPNIHIIDQADILRRWPTSVQFDPKQKRTTGESCPVDDAVAALAGLIRDDTRLMLVDSLAALRISEDNDTLAKLGYLLNRVAEEKQCAIVMAHHKRKPPPGSKQSGDINNARGGSALLASARATMTLTYERDESGSKKITRADGRRSYAEELPDTEWQFQSVKLSDAEGDKAAILVPYEPPAIDHRWSESDIRQALRQALELPDGERLKHKQTLGWVGNAFAARLPDSPDVGAEAKNDDNRNEQQKRNRRHVEMTLARAEAAKLIEVRDERGSNRKGSKGNSRKVCFAGPALNDGEENGDCRSVP